MENTEEENWEVIDGFKERYSISDLGRIRNNHTKTLKILSAGLNGYVRTGLSLCGKVKTVSVHALVAEYFIDRDYRSKGLVVNHKNFIRKDNRKGNLEVTTQRENANKKHIKGTSEFTGVHRSKDTGKFVASIVVGTSIKYLGSFDIETDAADAYNKALEYVNGLDFDPKWLEPKAKTSKHKGIHFCKTHRKWIARIKINKNSKCLGSFDTEGEAFIARQTYENQLSLF